MDIEEDNANKSWGCWVAHDGELYTADTGSLARSFGDLLKMLKWLWSKDDVSPGEYQMSIF